MASTTEKVVSGIAAGIVTVASFVSVATGGSTPSGGSSPIGQAANAIVDAADSSKKKDDD